MDFDAGVVVISKRGDEVIPRLSVLIGAYFTNKLGNQVI